MESPGYIHNNENQVDVFWPFNEAPNAGPTLDCWAHLVGSGGAECSVRVMEGPGQPRVQKAELLELRPDLCLRLFTWGTFSLPPPVPCGSAATLPGYEE